jgi:hypothetical protein
MALTLTTSPILTGWRKNRSSIEARRRGLLVNRKAARFPAVTIQFIIHPPYKVPAGLACWGKTWCNISTTVEEIVAMREISFIKIFKQIFSVNIVAGNLV